MDELSDIEARRDATVANLRRAFAAPLGEAPPTFDALLQRLAARAGAAAGSPATARASRSGPWSSPFADT